MLKGKMILIDLSSNNSRWISSTTFAGIQTNILQNVTALYMRNNRIKSIDRSSFLRFPRLCVLDLSSCELKVNTPKEFAFSNLTKLKILYISDNRFHSSKSRSYPESELSRLSSLEELHIDVFNQFRFGRNFERLKHLSKVQFHPTGSIFHLRNNTFRGLSKSPIENLTMDFQRNVQCDVSEDTLCSFPSLKRAYMTFGGLCDLDAVLKTLKCLESRTFEDLSSAGNVPVLIRKSLILNEENCKYLLKICVKKVDFSRNHIHGISVNLLETTFGKCIEYLDISRNEILFMKTSFVIDFIKNYPKLYYIDASYTIGFLKIR
jgi:Leucine-rich repeat (LRR) protein